MTEGQQRAFARFWPAYGLSLHDGIIDPADVFKRRAPLVLEIGFGMGDSLLQMAEAEPDKDFIGIEVHTPGVGRLINGAGGRELQNLRVYLADAVDVLAECIPDASLSRLQLYFPDPWHKKKHNKRRIVQSEFVHQVRRKLIPGGVFHIATDWEHYALQMRDVMAGAEGFSNLGNKGGFAERPAYRPVTKFENRGAKLGHGVWDLLFARGAGGE